MDHLFLLILIICSTFKINFSEKKFNVTEISEVEERPKKLICYYTNWSQYRPQMGKFLPEDLDPFLCTHIVFAFGWMKKNRIVPFDKSDDDRDGKQGLYSRIVDLKNSNPDLKILLALGGWSFGTQRFKDVSSTRYNRQLFTMSTIEFLRVRGFDGLDIDWEFPKGPEDRRNFAILLKDLREAFEEEALELHLEPLLLSIAVSAGADTVRQGYDIPEISKYVDYINVMSYDFHGKWENRTGHNSPLHPPADEFTWKRQLCVEYSMGLWERYGAPRNKLIVGLATYGRTFTLKDPDDTGMNAPTIGGGFEGPYTKERGFLAYYEICELMKGGADYVWNDHQKVPYLIKDDQWIGFDNERSLQEKVQWLLSKSYAGAMVWTVDMDDFTGKACGGKSFPLVRTIAKELRQKVQKQVKTPSVDLDADNHISLTKRKAQFPVVRNETLQPEPNVEDRVTIMTPETNARIVCYYTNWSGKRPGLGKFVPEYIDPFLCTHVIFAFASIENGRIVTTTETDSSNKSRTGLYERIFNLRKKNPALKVLISIGGWMVGSEPFREVTKTNYRKMSFIFNLIEFLRENEFDGLDIDWEFPRGEEEKQIFTKLIEDIRIAFDGEAKNMEKPKLLFSIAVPASYEAIASGYDVADITRHVDMMNILTYDFHGDWEKTVGHNSPLYPLIDSNPFQEKLTVNYSALEWVRRGAFKEKLHIGLPTYGRTFTLSNASSNDIGAPVHEGGAPGKYTKESGFLAFYEICDFLKSGATLIWDDEQMVPYAFKGDQWVGFDDVRSMGVKTKWLKDNGFGGAMIWAIDMDDFRGNCVGKPFPLIHAVKEHLKGYQVLDISYEANLAENTFEKRIGEVDCDEEEGQISYHADMSDCTKYYMCDGRRRHHMPCPHDLVYNPEGSVCDWPENVEDCQVER